MRKFGVFGSLILAFVVGIGCGGDGGATPVSYCLAGTAAATVCTTCGPAGGCTQTAVRCMQPCTGSSECSAQGQSCYQGFCQIPPAPCF